RVRLVQGNFRDIKGILAGLGAGPVDGIVLDLGVSSYQLDRPERGFSFRFDAPLDMRMDSSAATTARDLVNTLEAGELTRIFREYGEERDAARIARAIVTARSRSPVETTGDLVRILEEAVPKRFQPKKIHPATRVFQALRIAVNDELESLKDGITGGIESLAAGGRMVVISFHSLEDRIVKTAFRDSSTGCVCPPRVPACVCGRKPVTRLLTKKAVSPSDEEVGANPRARSAKLRAVERL
ncbi:MAG TPA: 16S rRNA (cytosine(1402)-N(4))-methyltransferase RsmH, partial [Thermodesulfobacteriota bacterium]|nr:16S rRNA (cytosine(1402)-N(4))-methyltransferase RsmH [Thermodesulfobacteriota bacterium]